MRTIIYDTFPSKTKQGQLKNDRMKNLYKHVSNRNFKAMLRGKAEKTLIGRFTDK